jgi:hypothetical protein
MGYKKAGMLRLVLSSSNAIGSKTIRFLTWSSWSHVGIVCGANDDQVIEATYPRVRKVSLDEFLEHKTLSIFIDIPCPDVRAAIKAAEDQIGKRYDICGLFAFFGFQRRLWYQDNRWFCSELAAYALLKGGTELFRPNTLNRVVPQLFWILNF